jgi:hypothetical protein
MEALAKAIFVRQDERKDAGEPELTEMWLPPATYEAVIAEASRYCTEPCAPVPHPKFYGVELRRIGSP